MKEATSMKQKGNIAKRNITKKEIQVKNMGKSGCEILEKVAILSLTFFFPAIFSMHSKKFNMKHREAINNVHQFFVKSE